MAIDLETERGLTLAEAAKLFPPYRPGKATPVSRILRKIIRGEPLPDGSRDFLEALKFGGQWITTARCIREHGERVAAAYVGRQVASTPIRTAKARSRNAAKAARELDRIGM